MTTQFINAENARYLSEVLTDLPHNCHFNKVLTGSGGTTIALTNNENYIIAVPFRALIASKMAQNPNVLGVYGGVTDTQIATYVATQNVQKIMVTYDSLPRLIKFIEPQDYRLLVDESHKLIDSGSFRGKAIRGVIDNFRLFKSYTFMTATPVKDKYQLPELKDLPKVSVKWSDITPVSVSYKMFESDLNRKITAILVDYLTGKLSGNPYIFINSVKSIIDIIKYLKKAGYDNHELYKIVVADNSDNADKIKKGLGKGFVVSPIESANRKITFLTSTAFEGCDIYDEDGVSYILTDGTKDNTKIDILTLMPQIIGRIRNSKVKDYVNVMFTPSPYFSYTTEAEFEEYVKGQLAEAQGYVDTYNSTPLATVKKALYDAAKSNAFVIEDDNKIIVNQEAWYSEMHNFEAMHTTYYVKRVNGVASPRTDCFTTSINDVPYLYAPANVTTDITLADSIKLGERVNVAEIAERYCKDRDNAKDMHTTYTGIIIEVESNKDYEYIVEGYKVLGSDKMKALEYRKNKIQDALVVANKEMAMRVKVAKLMNLNVNDWISLSDAKSKLQKVYDSLDINRKAKATDLASVYGIKEQAKRVDGKRKDGFAVIANIYKFK